MVKKNQSHINKLNALTDAVLVLLTYCFASWLWLDVLSNDAGNMASIRNLSSGLLLCALAYSGWTVCVLTLFSVYHTDRVQSHRRHYGTVLIANTVSLATVTTIFYLFRLQEFSRGVLGLYYLFSSCALIGKRMAMHMFLSAVRTRGYNLKHVLVVGSGDLAKEYAQCVADEPQLGLKIDEILTPDKDLSEKLEARIHNAGIDEVVLALEMHDLKQTEKVVHICEKNGVKTSVVPFYNSVISSTPTVENVGSVKLIRLRTIPLDEPGKAFLKRAFDIVVSAGLLLILSPLLLIIAVSVKLSSPGPIIFKQERVGLNRKTFTMLKFRSMRQNAEENSAWSSNVDNRRTFLGSLIRKTSLDELPQLWNVLRGDMSLIGPRPEIPCFVDQFRDTVPRYMLKHQVRPGITGWAQVKGYRGDTSIPGRIKCDLWYIENWSFLLDIKILFMTVFGGMVNKEIVGEGKA